MIDNDDTIAIVLAGGVGSRLHPLTEERAKPAVPFGGQYRIIDFTLSNCLHSGVRRILVLTQYKSHSLQKHLRDGWSIFNPELGEYITPVPPQMRTGDSWYQGTADAVNQNRYLIERSGAKNILVLSGDHVYRMDYAAMLAAHDENRADVTVACMQVGLEEARSFGVMATDNDNRVVRFQEKPEKPVALPDQPGQTLASMGVYVFSADALLAALDRDSLNPDSHHDFGHNILPQLIETQSVYAHRFGQDDGRVSPDRYWRDVGTLDAYYEANMDLLKPIPPMNLYQTDWHIRSYTGQYPPARTVPGDSGSEGITINSIMGSGSIIAGGSVQESVLFHSVFVEDEAMVQNSILFDDVRVGKGARLKRCIVDKDVYIPDGEQIGFDSVADAARFHISESGVVVVPKKFRFD
jgi:glucose-1-phosphate adenylyltransferase